MSLNILVILVIGGIAAIAALLHFSGRSAQRVLSPDEARAEWLRHFPDDPVEDLRVTHDGHAAILRTEQGPGLLWAFGTDTVARQLRDFDLVETERGLRVSFHDMTAAAVTLHLDADERGTWQEWMRPR
jgi:hypothetical protein